MQKAGLDGKQRSHINTDNARENIDREHSANTYIASIVYSISFGYILSY